MLPAFQTVRTAVVFLLIFVITFRQFVIGQSSTNYYSTYTSYITLQGDTIIRTYLQYRGFAAPHHRWLVECQDQEAMYGIFDYDRDFLGILKVWCKNVFPLKPPSRGIYPYYPKCFVREAFAEKEFFCFDQRAPEFTANSFLVGIWEPQGPGYLFMNFKQKCCTAPPGYYIQYPLCYYKYTHDQWGEHFDSEWLVTCDAPTHIITGMGHARNPWDERLHIVWILCCPLVFSPFVPILFLPELGVPLPTVQHVPDVVYGYGSYHTNKTAMRPNANGTVKTDQHVAHGPRYRVLHASTLYNVSSEDSNRLSDPLHAVNGKSSSTLSLARPTRTKRACVAPEFDLPGF